VSGTPQPHTPGSVLLGSSRQKIVVILSTCSRRVVLLGVAVRPRRAAAIMKGNTNEEWINAAVANFFIVKVTRLFLFLEPKEGALCSSNKNCVGTKHSTNL